MSEAAYTSEGMESPPSKQCSSLTNEGKPCNAYAVRGGSKCHLHSKTPEQRREQAANGAARSASVRAEVAREREDKLRQARLGTQARLAALVEELQGDMVAAYKDAIATGSSEALERAKASELLLSRVYGRPTQVTQDATPDLPQSIQALMDMTPEERRARLIALSSDSPPSAP